MHLALERAGLNCSQVDWFNAHATSTPAGDVVENRALKMLFECDAPSEWYQRKREASKDPTTSAPESRWSEVCVSSTKGATGHLLGAAGAIEAVFSICSIINVCMDLISCDARANFLNEEHRPSHFEPQYV